MHTAYAASRKLILVPPAGPEPEPESCRSGESLDEVEGGLGELAPAVVDGKGVGAVRDLHDLRQARIALLPRACGVRERPQSRVVLSAVDDQQGPAVRGLGVDLRLGPRVEVRVAHLRVSYLGASVMVLLLQLLRLLLVQRVRPAVL